GLAFLTSSRLSPVASLLGGLQYLVLGALPLLELSGLRLLPGNWLPYPFASGFMNVGYTGLLFLLGVFLLAVSAFPSRGRGRPAPSAPPYPGPPPADSPYQPWRGDDATQHMGRNRQPAGLTEWLPCARGASPDSGPNWPARSTPPAEAPSRHCTPRRPRRCSAWWSATPPATSTPGTPRPWRA